MTTAPYKPWLDVVTLMKQAHKIAASLLNRYRGPSCDPSEVVNATLEHLYRTCKGDWKDQDYFFAAMHQAMRDYLAARHRKKPPAGTLVQADSSFDQQDFKALSDATSAALRMAIKKLAASEKIEHQDWARVITEYYYVGEEEPAIALKLGKDLSTIKRYRIKGLGALGVLLGAVPSVGEEDAKKK